MGPRLSATVAPLRAVLVKRTGRAVDVDHLPCSSVLRLMRIMGVCLCVCVSVCAELPCGEDVGISNDFVESASPFVSLVGTVRKCAGTTSFWDRVLQLSFFLLASLGQNGCTPHTSLGSCQGNRLRG